MARGLGRFLLAACVASALLPSGAKKAKKRKPSFIETAAKREKYIDYLFERYDGDGDKALGEEEVDTANDEEPLFRVHHKYDDTLNTVFDLDRLDTDKSRKVTRHELMPALAELEGLRQKQLEDWGSEASNKAQLLKDIEDFHECTDEPENEHFGYEFGKRHGDEETPDKQKWVRREFMPEDKMAELVKKYTGMFTAEEVEEQWTMWVLQGKSWKNFEPAAEIMQSQKDRDGRWKYSEGCIDPNLIDMGEGEDEDADMSMPKKKRKKPEKVTYEPVAFRPGDLKEGESIQEAIARGAAQKLDPAAAAAAGWKGGP